MSASRDLDADPDLDPDAGYSAAFLAVLEAAGKAHRQGLGAAVPINLELRVRAALARDATRRPARRYVAAAALALVALGAALWSRPAGQAEAMPPQILKATEAAQMTADTPEACRDGSATSPVHFPLVKDGSLRILRCVSENGGTVARLYRPEDLPSVGYVAVPEPGAETIGPDIGMTDVGQYVVYDLAYGSQRHYLAVSKTFLERERALTPGRESCRACHNRSREGKANPHNIVARSWRTGG